MRRASLRKTFATGLTLILASPAASVAHADPPGYLFQDFGQQSSAHASSDANVNASRRNTVILGFLGSFTFMSLVFFTRDFFFTRDPVQIALYLAASLFFLEMIEGPVWAVPRDIAPRYAGVAGGFVSTAADLAAVRNGTALRAPDAPPDACHAIGTSRRPRGNRHLLRFLCEPSARYTTGQTIAQQLAAALAGRSQLRGGSLTQKRPFLQLWRHSHPRRASRFAE
jgi:hypothetical protein